MFLFSSLLFVYCRPAMLLLHGGAFIMLHLSFFVSYIGKMIQKIIFLHQKFAHIKKKQYLCSVIKKQNNN